MTVCKKFNPLNDALIEMVRKPIYSTWNNIAADGESICDGDNEVAIELCIDANRLTSLPGWGASGKEAAKVAEAAIEEALRLVEYKKLLKFLSKRIRLVD